MNNDKNCEKPFEPIGEDEILKYCCPSASWGDMTGLIPFASEKNGDLEAYNDVYPYLADDQSLKQ